MTPLACGHSGVTAPRVWQPCDAGVTPRAALSPNHHGVRAREQQHRTACGGREPAGGCGRKVHQSRYRRCSQKCQIKDRHVGPVGRTEGRNLCGPVRRLGRRSVACRSHPGCATCSTWNVSHPFLFQCQLLSVNASTDSTGTRRSFVVFVGSSSSSLFGPPDQLISTNVAYYTTTMLLTPFFQQWPELSLGTSSRRCS